MIRRRRVGRPRLVAVALIAASIPSLASAGEPATSDAAAAEALFEEGRRLLDKGDVKAACPKFAESYRLDPALGALLNLAACHEREGRSATAWSEFKEAETQAAAAGDQARRKLAADHVAALEPELARLTVSVREPPTGIVVLRDGVALGEGAFGVALPVDPGTHVIVARAPGRLDWTKRFSADPRGAIRIDVPALALAPSNETGKESSDAGDGRRTAGLVVGGAGLIALAVGGVFIGLTAAAKADADPHCPDKACDAEGSASIDTARTYAWIADIGIGIGALAVVAGGVLFWTAPRGQRASPPTSIYLVPSAGVNRAGLDARLTF